MPTQLARRQIASLRGKAKASLVLAVDDIRRRGCAAAGVLLAVAEHTRSANHYQLLYEALGIGEPDEPRTKPTCCDPDGHPPISAEIVARSERGLRDLARGQSAAGKPRR